jgi:hypothetical protein
MAESGPENEIEITPAMVAAGLRVLYAADILRQEQPGYDEAFVELIIEAALGQASPTSPQKR